MPLYYHFHIVRETGLVIDHTSSEPLEPFSHTQTDIAEKVSQEHLDVRQHRQPVPQQIIDVLELKY